MVTNKQTHTKKTIVQPVCLIVVFGGVCVQDLFTF